MPTTSMRFFFSFDSLLMCCCICWLSGFARRRHSENNTWSLFLSWLAVEDTLRPTYSAAATRRTILSK